MSVTMAFPSVTHDPNPPAAFEITRALIQTLSNMVTANNGLISKLWELYMNLPEEQVIIM